MSRSLRPGLLLAVSLAGLCACRHRIQPSPPRAQLAEAGVPITFLSTRPKSTWTFGDGTPAQPGEQAVHAYAKPGHYLAEASVDGQRAQAVDVTVVPRPALHAIPAQAIFAVWMETAVKELPPLVDFVERGFGPAPAQSLLEEAPLAQLCLELAAGRSQAELGVSSQEGLGMFIVPDFSGTFALVGVDDPERALSALEERLGLAGAKVERGEGSSRRFTLEEGAQVWAFVDRGYLYTAFPKMEDGQAFARFEDAQRVLQDIPASGLLAGERFARAWPLRAPGSVQVFADFRGEHQARVGALIAGLGLAPSALEVRGRILGAGPSWHAPEQPLPHPVDGLEEGPIAVASLSVHADELAEVLFGKVGSDRRQAMLSKSGLDPSTFVRLIDAFTGELGAAAYVDARELLTRLSRQDSTLPLGAHLEARLAQGEKLGAMLETFFERTGVDAQTVMRDGMEVVHGSTDHGDFELELSKNRLRGRIGQPLGHRLQIPLGEVMAARFGKEAFGPGHLTLLVDLGQARRELERVDEVSGVSDERLVLLKSLARAFLDRVTPVDTVFVDAHPEPDGASFRARMVLTTKESGP